MHTRLRAFAVPAALLSGSALVLAGCASADDAGSAASGDEGTVRVVASTDVYADIVEAIAGERVEVRAIIDSTGQDPHSYEASAQDQLTVSEADLIVENGGGYDAFVDSLADASGTEAEIITAVEFSHDYPGDTDDAHDHEDEHDHDDDGGDEDGHEGHDHIEGFNEHVWYDPHTMAYLAESIAAHLTELDADGADTYAAGLADFVAGIEDLEASLADIDDAHGGAEVFATEPVPGYLVAAAGLVDVTPSAFSEAVEEGQDVPPATLLEAQRLIESGDVSTVIVNAQTGGAETDAVIGVADDTGIPVIEFSETLPEGESYLTWMQANIDALAGSLTE